MSDNPEIWPNPPGVSVEYLLDLVTWEHNQRPRYMATVALSVDPYIDGQNIALGYQTLYNIDTAVGEQLDFIGQWVGITRYITEPINVFFSFDDIDEDVGFDEGKWQSEFEFTSLSHVIKLDDEQYRLLLKARIVSNHWDGTVEGAYRAWDTLFAGTGYSVLIQDGLPAAEHYFTFDDPEKGLFGFDMVPFWSGRQFRYPHYNGNMNIIIALMSDKPVDAIMRTLFREGYMGLDSAGVGTSHLIQNSADIGKPLFAFDAGPETPWVTFNKPGLGHNQAFIYASYGITLPPGLDVNTYPPTVLAGFDLGAWARILNLAED